MRADELMIGDWVMDTNRVFPSKVAGLTHGKIYTWRADGTKYAKNEVNFVSLLLTTELLERNGFMFGTSIARQNFDRIIGASRPNDEKWHTPNDWVVLKHREEDDGFQCWDVEGLCGIEYVHELQHALRLHGLIDEADNFKI